MGESWETEFTKRIMTRSTFFKTLSGLAGLSFVKPTPKPIKMSYAEFKARIRARLWPDLPVIPFYPVDRRAYWRLEMDRCASNLDGPGFKRAVRLWTYWVKQANSPDSRTS